MYIVFCLETFQILHKHQHLPTLCNVNMIENPEGEVLICDQDSLLGALADFVTLELYEAVCGEKKTQGTPEITAAVQSAIAEIEPCKLDASSAQAQSDWAEAEGYPLNLVYVTGKRKPAKVLQ